VNASPLPPGTTRFAVTGLPPGTSWFTVRAVNVAGKGSTREVSGRAS